jgi:ATP-binding cassette subfamily C protein EexD
MILHLPEGYDTVIGQSGGVLSGGQRQRIGLARALYGDPALIVLDEPNSNLDDQGEHALRTALATCKQKGRTIVLITHSVSLLSHVDKLMLMKEGQLLAFGPRDEVLGQIQASKTQAQSAQKLAAAGGQPSPPAQISKS